MLRLQMLSNWVHAAIGVVAFIVKLQALFGRRSQGFSCPMSNGVGYTAPLLLLLILVAIVLKVLRFVVAHL